MVTRNSKPRHPRPNTTARTKPVAEPQPAPAPTAFTERDVVVSALVGTGADAHRIVTVGPWCFTVQGAEGTEPLIRDVDAAERLGFARPRKIREIITRIWPENQRPHVRPTVGRTSMPNGGTRETVVQEFWLTEAQLLKVCARSETPVAEAILDEMIAVYMLARRGLLVPAAAATATVPGVNPADFAAVVAILPVLTQAVQSLTAATTAQVARLDAAIAALSERCDRVERVLSSGVVGHDIASDIRRRFTAASRRVGDRRAASSFLRRWSNLIRNAVHFTGAHTPWHSLPHASFATVQALLTSMETEAAGIERESRAARAREEAERQGELFKKN